LYRRRLAGVFEFAFVVLVFRGFCVPMFPSGRPAGVRFSRREETLPP
jgi:hypothetical protein